MSDNTTIKMEILFIEESGSYRVLYENGELVEVVTQSQHKIPQEIELSFAQTIENFNALGYAPENEKNSLSVQFPMEEGESLILEFIKGGNIPERTKQLR